MSSNDHLPLSPVTNAFRSAGAQGSLAIGQLAAPNAGKHANADPGNWLEQSAADILPVAPLQTTGAT
jgi:hypothetical protein